MSEDKNLFSYLPYFEIYQKYQKIDDVLETLHYAKISDENPSDEILNECILIMSNFVDEWNKQYSRISGIKLDIHITSKKWKEIVTSSKNNQFFLPTFSGFGK